MMIFHRQCRKPSAQTKLHIAARIYKNGRSRTLNINASFLHNCRIFRLHPYLFHEPTLHESLFFSYFRSLKSALNPFLILSRIEKQNKSTKPTKRTTQIRIRVRGLFFAVNKATISFVFKNMARSLIGPISFIRYSFFQNDPACSA